MFDQSQSIELPQSPDLPEASIRPEPPSEADQANLLLENEALTAASDTANQNLHLGKRRHSDMSPSAAGSTFSSWAEIGQASEGNSASSILDGTDDDNELPADIPTDLSVNAGVTLSAGAAELAAILDDMTTEHTNSDGVLHLRRSEGDDGIPSIPSISSTTTNGHGRPTRSPPIFPAVPVESPQLALLLEPADMGFTGSIVTEVDGLNIELEVDEEDIDDLEEDEDDFEDDDAFDEDDDDDMDDTAGEQGDGFCMNIGARADAGEFGGVELITPRRSFKGAKNFETVKDCG